MTTANLAAHWAAHAETEAREAQQALDDFDSLTTGSGGFDAERVRRELIAARDEYADDVDYWQLLCPL